MMSVVSLSGSLSFPAFSKHGFSRSVCQYSSLMQNISESP